MPDLPCRGVHGGSLRHLLPNPLGHQGAQVPDGGRAPVPHSAQPAVSPGARQQVFPCNCALLLLGAQAAVLADQDGQEV